MSEVRPPVQWIRHRLPIPIRVVLGFCVPITLLLTWSSIFDTKQYGGAAGVALVGGALALLIYTNHSGYRVGWDHERVYMRNWGFRNLLFQRHLYHSMTYEEMEVVEGYFPPPDAGPSAARIMPYQNLEIKSREAAVENISLYPSGLNEEDLAVFLIDLYGKRRDIFPEAILDNICVINDELRGDEFRDRNN